jgi:Ca-activated chloride channel family protein
VALLAPLDDAGSLYNRGTALARLGRFQEALAALEGALARDPAHADARHNHRLIQELLAARQQQPDEPGAGESGPDAETPPPGERGDAGDRSPPAEEAPGTETEPPEPGAPEPGDEAEASGAGKPPDTAAQALPRPADAPEATEADLELRESAQATEQWLSRIPDDPGGLLRNKFRQQYRRGRDPGAAEPSDEEPW